MATAADSAKDRMIAIIESQPDDSSYDEILRELALARMINRGLADSDAGKVVSDEEMGRRIQSWQDYTQRGHKLRFCTMGLRARRRTLSQSDGLGGPSYRFP
jgi:predicted transcriptional regulator